MVDIINLQMEKLLILSPTFWKNELAVLIYGLIYRDMKRGKVQAFTAQKRQTSGGAENYSKQYKKYKMNFMKKFGRSRKQKEQMKAKTEKGKGEYLKGIRKVISNSATPNMMLSGETIMGLEYLRSTADSLTMTYNKKDEKKITGNADMGRLITTLSEENKEKVRRMIEDELVNNISKWYRDRIIITVG